MSESSAPTFAMAPPKAPPADPNVRPMLFRLGVQISLAIVNSRSLPEDLAGRLGTDLAVLKRVLAGDESGVSVETLLAIARETGSRLEISFLQPGPPARPAS